MTAWTKQAALALAWTLFCTSVFSGPLRDRIMERRITQQELDGEDAASSRSALPAGLQIIHDVPYGADAKQRFDVYLPAQPNAAPVILMVHGGGWRIGDKAMGSVVENKAARWVPKGFIFVSANYRLLPQADPREQARDIARAIAAVQSKAASWGGDPAKVILMGHSAGSHLVSLLTTDRAISSGIVTTPWLGTVALDSAAFDVEKIMQARHLPLYDSAFGRDPDYWRSASPYHVLTAESRPILAVCSTRRASSCDQASQFAAKAVSLGVRASVLEKNFSHRDINQRLGADPAYTAEVESFLASLDTSVAHLLAFRPGPAR